MRIPKTFEPVGWQQLAGQLRGSNIPMDLVGNIARRQHIQKGEITPRKKQATTPRKKQTVSQRKNTSASSRRLGVLLNEWWSQRRRTMPRSCMVAVVIFIFAAVVVLPSSSDRNIWCARGVAPWGGKKLQRYYDQKLVEIYGGVAAL